MPMPTTAAATPCWHSARSTGRSRITASKSQSIRGMAMPTMVGAMQTLPRETSMGLSINPRHPYAYCGRADAYQKIGDLDKAIEDYSKQISTNPRHDYAYNGRANAHLAKGDFERAIDD